MLMENSNMTKQCSTYLQLFKGNEEHISQQGDNFYHPIHKPLGEYYLNHHFNGNATFGLYLLTKESNCHLVCIDIDIDKKDLNNTDFKSPSTKYEYLSNQLNTVLKALQNDLRFPDNSILLEETGGRGYHIWIFLSEPISGNTAISFGSVLKSFLDFDVEFFPKQGELTKKRKYGNLIKLPLGVHKKYGSRSTFFKLYSHGPIFNETFDENIKHLEQINTVDPEFINKIIEAYKDVVTIKDQAIIPEDYSKSIRVFYKGTPDFHTSKCNALGGIWTKAMNGEELSHSETFHFANVMLSVKNQKQVIHELIKTTYSSSYSFNKTEEEISRILPLNPTSCNALYQHGICPGYCKPSIKKKVEDPLAPNTSPCSVWLTRDRFSVRIDRKDLGLNIGRIESVKRSYFRLKQYHEHEDSLFFDPFDFELFENKLEENCQVISHALKQKVPLDLTGYLKVQIPKKLDEELVLQKRGMSYSTIFDQVPIQSVFDVIAPFLEHSFNDCSYGYRWNSDSATPLRIFEDWHVAYPKFRAEIMESILKNPNGYHACCDIKGYYDHIKHDILIQQIRQDITDPYISDFIEKIIQQHEHEVGRRTGLPQGPAYARILANLYLTDLDNYISEITVGYFRYVDDFVLLFETEEKAKSGIDSIVARLDQLGLELSQDKDKAPTIEKNINLSKILKTLDKIQYGILESTRNIQHYEPEMIEEFYDAVQRHSGTPGDFNQLIKINDALPSLLYIISQESSSLHPFKGTIMGIVGFLIKKHWFFPKRLKIVFYRLLELETNKMLFLDLWDRMEDAHKVYFLLSVFGCFKNDKIYSELLEELLQRALNDDDPFVFGLAISMTVRHGLDVEHRDLINVVIGRIQANKNTWFEIAKFVGDINYLSLKDEDKETIRKLVHRESPYLLKTLLLNRLQSFPKTYLDSKYLESLISDFYPLLVPSVTNLLSEAEDKSVFLDATISFMSLNQVYRDLGLSLLKKSISKRLSTAGITDIENLKELYNSISDKEVRDSLLRVLGQAYNYETLYDIDFAKTHTQIGRYNGCFLFEHLEDRHEYCYMELIPEERIQEFLWNDITSIRKELQSLSEKEVFSPLNIYYDNCKKEISIHFKTSEKHVKADKDQFTLETQSIIKLLKFVSNAFKKALFFRKVTGKVPLITIENLLFK